MAGQKMTIRADAQDEIMKNILKHLEPSENEIENADLVIDDLLPESNSYSFESLQKLICGQIEYILCDDVNTIFSEKDHLKDDLFDQIVEEGQQLRMQGFFKSAGVGKGQSH